jgi:hypothetical protein
MIEVIGVVLAYFFKLSALQLTVQVLALVGTHLQQGSNQFIDGLSYLLGLTGMRGLKYLELDWDHTDVLWLALT